MDNKAFNIKPADRLGAVSEYYFSRKLKEIARLNAEGKNIISLAIGSPDMPPSKETIEVLCEQARRPDTHGYKPTIGTPELRKAMAGFYKRWYDVDLDPSCACSNVWYAFYSIYASDIYASGAYFCADGTNAFYIRNADDDAWCSRSVVRNLLFRRLLFRCLLARQTDSTYP